YKTKGVKANYWEIGNESYIFDSGPSSAYLTAQQYASLFDSFAPALRAVDPNIHVGMTGCHDTPASPLQLCNDPNWNQNVLSHVASKIDFMAIHNSYAPAVQALPSDTVQYHAILAAPQIIRPDFALQ